MSKTERFEMRLDEETATAIDRWRDTQMAGVSRAQAVRALIGHGLNHPARFSDGERTLIKLMGDLFAHVGSSTSQTDLILNGLKTGNEWIVDLELGAFLNKEPTTSITDARFVLATLEMWDLFEHTLEGFDEEQMAVVLAETEGEIALRQTGKTAPPREFKFSGFDAESETDFIKIADFIINTMQKFPRFKGRDLRCGQQGSSEHYLEKLNYHKSLVPLLIDRSPSAEEVRTFTLQRANIAIGEFLALNEMRRRTQSDLS
ncbi:MULTISPECIES: hypothetical protein [unclassified Pseudomonas]|uniref:hypothetical protein n=1 Tax=unclassified Pseudomonas TaxID=196821 RepID=UPI0011AF74A4|nr:MULTISPECIES: hypothetical protein [unclassified Pseudomonas]